MPIQKLFDENDQYTEAGTEFSRAIDLPIRNIFERYPDFSIRDMATIIHSTVTTSSSFVAFMRRRAAVPRPAVAMAPEPEVQDVVED